MLRASPWMCGSPCAWMSPSARSSRAGLPSSATAAAASKYPAAPGRTFAFEACWITSGSQPASSSAPVATTRSAPRARAMRLGRASMRCGSCSAVVAVYTFTFSPPSSCASAPHSGTVAKTLICAAAGKATDRHSIASSVVFMAASITMRTVGPEAQDVLQEHLVVGQTLCELAAGELQAQARELRGAPVDHRARAPRRVVDVVHAARIEPVVTHARAPFGMELPHALQVPAALARSLGDAAIEVFTLQLEAAFPRVATRSVLPHEVGDREAPRGRARDLSLGLLERGSRAQVRHARAPARIGAQVAAKMRERRRRAHAVSQPLRARVRVSVAYLAAELDEGLRRRHPLQLNAVGGVVVAEECLVREG